ncbi:hypothetical protein [Streptomyces silvisoli]|uniref:Uncharacterized protein n=1 Tax=Streptomyces silvisoli TaxID=3034235 RepID=A0ABT5ZFL8_9ACTN|nr:hypothetical protein [Streptomyces silvisoli]MDF3288491.1 hypothetical protein [Streptomyces silvisoli]
MSRRNLPRLRVQRTIWPRPALVLTDTPRPDCRECHRQGGTEHDYGDPETGEYAGWTHWRCVLLPLPRLPRWLRRGDGRDPWATGGYSDEPPF